MRNFTTQSGKGGRSAYRGSSIQYAADSIVPLGRSWLVADHVAPELFECLGVGVGVTHERADCFAAVEQLANRSADGVGPGADDHRDLTGLRRPLTHR